MTERNKLAGLLACDGTFDIECYDWDRFLVAATYEPACGSKLHRSAESLVSYLLFRGGTWWSHCGGQYDSLAVANEFDRRGLRASIDYPRSRVSRLVGSGLTLRDSYALIPMGLEKVAAMVGMPCPEMPWRCTCPLRCGGYCRLTSKLIGGDPDLDAYCAADCYVLYRGLERIAEHASEHGLDLRGTIGSTAWATARRLMSIPDAALPSQTWKQIKAADYGGRTIIVRPTARGPGTHWDLSSAYPAALARCELPVGDPTRLGHRNAVAAFGRSDPGIYKAKVTVPECLIPPLPYRDEHGRRSRLVYPVGQVTGSWVLAELHAAMERGVVVDKVISAVTFPRASVLFGSLMEAWYSIRRKVGKKTPLGEWQRLLANSLTGKFAEQPNRKTIRMHPESIKFCERTGTCSRGCTGDCDAYKQLDRWGRLWSQPYYRMAPSGHVQWSAVLKSYTRSVWLTEMEHHGDQGVYGDTDSIWTLSRHVPVNNGSALGYWERKHDFVDWECSAIKCYRYTDPANDTDVLRAAGAKDLTDSEWRAGTSDQSRGVLSLVEAAGATREDGTGAGLFRRRQRQWSMPGHDTDRVWFGDRKLAGTITRPVTVEEHRGRWSHMRTAVAKRRVRA